jgi:hypothetical protein
MAASANENIDVAEALLSKGTTTENLYKHNALCIAISNGHINVVQFLLEKGIYIIYDMFSDKPLPLTLAGQQGQPGILARLISIMVARQKAFEGRHDFSKRAINANMFPGLTDCERVYPRQWVHLLTDVSKVTLFTWIEARIADERACYLALNSVSLQRIIHDQGVLSEKLTKYLVHRLPVRNSLREIKEIIYSIMKSDYFEVDNGERGWGVSKS